MVAVPLPLSLPLSARHNECGQIANCAMDVSTINSRVRRSRVLTWKREWEVQNLKHNGEENIPPEHNRGKAECAPDNLKSACHGDIAIRRLPIRACQAGEYEQKGEEDQAEYEVGP